MVQRKAHSGGKEDDVQPMICKSRDHDITRYINKIFTQNLNIFIIVYLKNIFIYINDKRDSHIITI